MTISIARTKFIVNIEFFKNQNPYLKDNSSRPIFLKQIVQLVGYVPFTLAWH